MSFRGPVLPTTWSALRAPFFLPDGRHFIFGSQDQVWLGRIGDESLTRLRRARGTPTFAAPNYLLFVQGTGVSAQRLDLGSGKLVGEPRQILDRVITPAGRTALSVSNTGVLVARGPGAATDNLVGWVARGGMSIDSPACASSGASRLSRDGRRIAFGGWSLSLYDISRRVVTSAVQPNSA